MKCRYSSWMEYLWRMAFRKGAASLSSANSPEGKLGQWPWMTSNSVKSHYKRVYAKISDVFGLRTQETPKTAKLATKYLWGQPRSLTSDDLWKVKMQCQRSDMVISWPKSCVTSPFLSMAASYVAENIISLKNRSETVPLMTSYLCGLTWPGQKKLSQKLRKRCPMSYANFQHDPPSGSATISEKLLGSRINPSCTGEGSVFLALLNC